MLGTGVDAKSAGSRSFRHASAPLPHIRYRRRQTAEEVAMTDQKMVWGEAGSYPELYEQLAVPAFFERFARMLLERAQIAPGERVLDVAAGTGVVSRTVAREGSPGRLVGYDLTPAMVEVGKNSPGGDRVEWVLGNGQELPFEDDSFDVVLCQQGLQFFEDPVAGTSEMRRVLGGGGRVLAACWDRDEGSLFEVLVEVLGEFDEQLAQVAKTPFSMTPERFEEIFRAGGFEDVTIDRLEGEGVWPSAEQGVRTFLEGTPIALFLAGVDPERVAELRTRILERVGPQAEADGTVRTPMSTHLAVAHA
jgi:ubiquinone/menaquinone biosynthesis C-methylase UbiE